MSGRQTRREDCNFIVEQSIQAVLPHAAVKRALEDRTFGKGRLLLVAVGKAAYAMASAATDVLGDRINEGIVITKYHHSKEPLPHIRIYEAGHPVPDDHSYAATEQVLELTKDLNAEDTVLFLLSGGGSALFEKPIIPKKQVEQLNKALLACGANIIEINTIRKRMSMVKGGKFALHCAPARIITVVLSDIVGDPLDMIASGPTYPDSAAMEDVQAIINKYDLKLTPQMQKAICSEAPHAIDNVETMVTGNLKMLCDAAARACAYRGYEPLLLTDTLDCEAREAGRFLAAIAKTQSKSTKKRAIIVGGETIVHLKGNGKGGRNQELALAAAIGIDGLPNVSIFSFGSDGTDGPTDAAGGYVDGSTYKFLSSIGVSIHDVLNNNDAYHALRVADGLIMTGPTGTNVNDLSIVLIDGSAC